MKVTHTKALGDTITVAELCQNMDLFAVATASSLSVYRTTTGTCLWTLKETTGAFVAMSWSPTGKLVSAGLDNGIVLIVHVEKGEVLRVFGPIGSSPPSSAADLSVYPCSITGSIWRVDWTHVPLEGLLLATDAECLPVEDVATTALVSLCRKEWENGSASVLLVTNTSGRTAVIVGGAQEVAVVDLPFGKTPPKGWVLPQTKASSADAATPPTALVTLSGSRGLTLQDLSSLTSVVTPSVVSSSFLRELLGLGLEGLQRAVQSWMAALDRVREVLMLSPAVMELYRSSLTEGLSAPTQEEQQHVEDYFRSLDPAKIVEQGDRLIADCGTAADAVLQSALRAFDFALATAVKLGQSKVTRAIHAVAATARTFVRRMHTTGDRVIFLLQYAFQRTAALVPPESTQVLPRSTITRPVWAQHHAAVLDIVVEGRDSDLMRPIVGQLVDASALEAARSIAEGRRDAIDKMPEAEDVEVMPMVSGLPSDTTSLLTSSCMTMDGSLPEITTAVAMDGGMRIVKLGAASPQLPTMVGKATCDVVVEAAAGGPLKPSAKPVAVAPIPDTNDTALLVASRDAGADKLELHLLAVEEDGNVTAEADEDEGIPAGHAAIEGLNASDPADVKMNVSARGTIIVSHAKRFAIVDLNE